ncbi:polyphosphate kinase 1 [Fulvivirgaceae bacterium PWU4]|uniref:Polyphosphate kinase n=1 Tax=Chryseosolibacter histidini TaxID=2782349 RepID=A0AAP2GRE3_9BACT|nr:polyphosphate kinase 1 [Chryseosolibacter histidini]MBT1699910.1 polyphosphate kinase 1 [Chryseosolibacter histidini]
MNETVISTEKIAQQIIESNYVSRDLSWLQFNYRVLDQARHIDRSIFDRLKFLSITASNLDEFCTIRLGSLYNYIDYGKERFDYNGLREEPFRRLMLAETQRFVKDQNEYYVKKLKPLFHSNGFIIAEYRDLSVESIQRVNDYFYHTIFPMLTPMVFDNYHTFPVLMNNRLLFGVVTKNPTDQQNQLKVSFIQVPHNLPRFYEIVTDDTIQFVPVEDIISNNIHHLFRNVEIASVNLFRINRNGDFTLEESEDIESNFLEDLKRKLKTRRSGRVVRLEVEENPDPWMMRLLKIQWDLDDNNIFYISKESMVDFTGLLQIVNHKEFKTRRAHPRDPIKPLNFPEQGTRDLFEVLKERDILLHHPYNSMEPVLELLEKAADDPYVLSIKITIYRVARESRVTAALLKAAENGKHVSVLFEVKARFDEENNLREAQRLQKAGCFVIYGVSSLKTHTKLLLIVRKEDDDKVYRYVHLSSGNYNESTSRFYVDIGLLTTREGYAQDVSEFFNVITGHSQPSTYRNLITSPRDMRIQLCNLLQKEAYNARNGIPAGIVIKLNSLQDKEFIDEIYAASQSGVPIKLIVRGMCCLRPRRKGLSENIEVISIVGEFLEHSRIYYFHNAGNPKVYIGSADAMVRSFDRRIESLFLLEEEILKKQAINNLRYNLKDNVNSYIMQEDGSYMVKELNGEQAFNIHKEFYNVTKDIVMDAKLF